MLDLPPAPSWMRHAACRGLDPELFHPERGDSNFDVAQARAVCSRCPVRAECLDYAIDNDEQLGIWGGASRAERRQIARARRRAS